MQAHRSFVHRIVLSFLLLSTLCASAQQKLSLDEGWKFHFGHAANPEKDFNYGLSTIFSKSGAAPATAIDPRFNDSTWRSIDVPHDWAVELPFVEHPSFDVQSHGYKPVGGYFPETSIGWYRRKFSAAPADSGQRFQLQFDGIFRNASVWVNGFFTGANMSGYLGVSYDITDYINFHGPNVIVVRVDATQYEGWFYEGAGIYRHVWLNRYDNIHIPDGGFFAHAEVNGNRANVSIETSVENKNGQPARCTVASYVTTRDGRVVAQSAERPLSLGANGTGTITQSLTVSNPHLWNLDDPYLYRVVSVVRSGGRIVYTKKERLGFRTFRFDANEGFFLNGKHLKIQGTNNHQDHAGLEIGRAHV